jgi:hypothetical protein
VGCENVCYKKHLAMASFKCLPVLDHFLCGYSLQIGTIITGWLGLGTVVVHLLTVVVYFLSYGRQIPDWELLILSAVVEGLISSSVLGFLLYGAYKKKPSFMVPYLILSAISIITSSLVVIGFGAYAFLYSPGIGAITLVIGGLIVAVSAYLWLVVYSYYQQLNKCCSLPQHDGTVETVLKMGKNEDYMSYHKLPSQ